jgi:hypothetical protein
MYSEETTPGRQRRRLSPGRELALVSALYLVLTAVRIGYEFTAAAVHDAPMTCGYGPIWRQASDLSIVRARMYLIPVSLATLWRGALLSTRARA